MHSHSSYNVVHSPRKIAPIEFPLFSKKKKKNQCLLLRRCGSEARTRTSTLRCGPFLSSKNGDSTSLKQEEQQKRQPNQYCYRQFSAAIFFLKNGLCCQQAGCVCIVYLVVFPVMGAGYSTPKFEPITSGVVVGVALVVSTLVGSS